MKKGAVIWLCGLAVSVSSVSFFSVSFSLIRA